MQRMHEQALTLEPGQRGARDVARDAEPCLHLGLVQNSGPGG